MERPEDPTEKRASEPVPSASPPARPDDPPDRPPQRPPSPTVEAEPAPVAEPGSERSLSPVGTRPADGSPPPAVAAPEDRSAPPVDAGPPKTGSPPPADRAPEELAPKPTPPKSVREVMESVGVAAPAPPPDGRAFEDAEGKAWLARASGTSQTGAPSDAGAPIVLLRFYQAEDPHSPVREIFVVARTIGDLYDEELLHLLADAGPARSVLPRPPTRSHSRKRRRK